MRLILLGLALPILLAIAEKPQPAAPNGPLVHLTSGALTGKLEGNVAVVNHGDIAAHAVTEHGVTFFDAADAYGNGRSEHQLAAAFKGRRDEVVYGTKVGYDIYDEEALKARRGQSELPQRFEPKFMRMAVDKCLERLDSD